MNDFTADVIRAAELMPLPGLTDENQAPMGAGRLFAEQFIAGVRAGHLQPDALTHALFLLGKTGKVHEHIQRAFCQEIVKELQR